MFGREIVDERKEYLNRLLIEEDVFHYTYDLGGNWEHVITVESFNDKPELIHAVAPLSLMALERVHRKTSGL